MPSDSVPSVLFQGISEVYSVGDVVELSFKSVHFNPSTQDWLGIYLCDSNDRSDCVSWEFVPAARDTTDHDSDSYLPVALKIDFPVKEDMACYEVRYVSENKTVVGRSDPFKVTLVSHNESVAQFGSSTFEFVTGTSVMSLGDDFDDEKVENLVEGRGASTTGHLLDEIERRTAAERELMDLRRQLGEQMSTIDAQTEKVTQSRLDYEREKSLNESLTEQNKELQEQFDNLTVDYNRAHVHLQRQENECNELAKLVENQDRENASLKFQMVNSKERLVEHEEEDVLLKAKESVDAWTECRTLENNNDLLVEALKNEREKSSKLEEELKRITDAYELVVDLNEAEISGRKEGIESVTSLISDNIKVCEDSITEVEERCETKVNQLRKRLEEMNDRCKQVCKSYGNTIQELKDTHAVEMKSVKEELESGLKKCKENDKVREKSISDIRNEYIKEINSLKKKLETAVTKGKESDKAHEKTVRELNIESENEKSKLREELDNLTASKKESDKAYETTIAELESRVANESSNASRLENDLAVAEMRCRETDDDVKFFRQQLLDTEKKLQNGQTLLSKNLEEMNNLKNSIRSNQTVSRNIATATNGLITTATTSTSCDSNSESSSPPNSNSSRESSTHHSPDQQQNSIDANNNNKNDSVEEARPIPGIVKYNINNDVKTPALSENSESKTSDTDAQPISVIIDPRRGPNTKKGRRVRYSKPINLAYPPMHHHSSDHYSGHHSDTSSEVSHVSNFSREVTEMNRNQLESQYDAIRQHRNSLIRENTYLKNKVQSLVTDLVLLQKNLQDVINEAEQKVGVLQLMLGNQYLATLNAVQQNDLQQQQQQYFANDPNALQMIEPAAAKVDDIDTANYISEYGMIASPIKAPQGMKDIMSDPLMNDSQTRIDGKSYPSKNFLSPLAEEYKPVSAQNNNCNNSFDGSLSASPLPLNSSNVPPLNSSTLPTPLNSSNIELPPTPDAFFNYMLNNGNDSYGLPFPPPLPPTPGVHNTEQDMLDVTQQLASIGINFD